jgi:alkylation response protein AidB-like acyl-CoA dehydrogenase
VDTEIYYEALSETEQAVLDTLRRFATQVLRPAGKALDALAPDDVIASDSVLWDVHAKYQELGIDPLSPESDLPPAEAARLGALSSEMIGWGDAGLGVSLGVSNMAANMAVASGRPELCEVFTTSRIGCWAVTEPDHGSDMVDYGDSANAGEPGRSNCVAKRQGDTILINGQKSAWVSNGTIAQDAALFTAYEDADGSAGYGVFLVPLDSDGVTRGKPTNKIGQRPLNQGEIFFDDVVIPADYMVAGPDSYNGYLEMILAVANAGMGSVFAGLARAALEHAIGYAKERVQGGRPIIEHQAVRSRIFEMFRKVEAARALNLKVVHHNAVKGPRLELSIASKVTSTRTAMEVATEAMSIYGGAGIVRENPIEKLIRDASVSMIEDGENNLLGLIAASRL